MLSGDHNNEAPNDFKSPERGRSIRWRDNASATTNIHRNSDKGRSHCPLVQYQCVVTVRQVTHERKKSIRKKSKQGKLGKATINKIVMIKSRRAAVRSRV
jgi:hypothetical protein